MATRTISVAGGNFNATSAWDEAAVPVAGDAVVARGTGDSGNLTVNVASGGVGLLSFVMTNYTGTLTFNATLTVSGTVTLVAGMTIAGTSDLICNTTATLTSGGKTLTGGLQLKGTSQTYTMSGAWIVAGTLTLSGTTAITVNSSTLQCGNLTTTTATSGTCVITLNGGTWSGAGTLKNSLTFTGGPTVSGTVNYNTGTLTISSTLSGTATPLLQIALATTITGTSNINVPTTITANVTITIGTDLSFISSLTSSAGVTFSGAHNISCASFVTAGTTNPVTLSGTLTCSGDLTLGSTTSTTFSGNFAITAATATLSGTQTTTIAGAVTISGVTTISDACVINGAFNWTTQGLTTTGALTGTTVIHLSGGGTWQGAAACSNSVTLDASTTTLSGTVLYAASGTPTLSCGGFIMAGGVLSIASACTIASGNAVTSDLTITAALTLTINTTVLGIGTLTGPNAAVTFAGDHGFTCATAANTAVTAARIYTLTAGNTYTVTTALNWTGATSALTLTIISSHATNKVTLTLGYTATQDSVFMNGTRIDSSAGQAVYSGNAVITTCFNWATAVQGGALIGQTGQTLTVAGITKDKTGAALGSCVCQLFRDNGDGSASYLGQTTSDGTTGAYSFTTFPGNFFVRSRKAGSPNVFDTTDSVAAV